MRDAATRLRRLLSAVNARAITWMVPLVVLAAPAIVWAQENAPPQPSLKRVPARIIGYLVITLLLVIVVVVSLIPSKRGHQD